MEGWRGRRSGTGGGAVGGAVRAAQGAEGRRSAQVASASGRRREATGGCGSGRGSGGGGRRARRRQAVASGHRCKWRRCPSSMPLSLSTLLPASPSPSSSRQWPAAATTTQSLRGVDSDGARPGRGIDLDGSGNLVWVLAVAGWREERGTPNLALFSAK